MHFVVGSKHAYALELLSLSRIPTKQFAELITQNNVALCGDCKTSLAPDSAHLVSAQIVCLPRRHGRARLLDRDVAAGEEST